ncbi:hypothetical protein FVA81_10040 [Rhizobium sp. WL3]|uniref:hypothetical protein n=1 Tax=Rhizobium sp. WL3 TaxID=2603277 RepID=UPI0011C208B2|nr:hypothetical protein [Rhizobium sp. WL3]QEE44934.1 hypothetical protein FVA81_10040 [Rhizobium sp. WL3]
MKVPKIHLSRKLMLVLGGVLVTLGGTGAAAVYIGADTLLGPSYAELNGLECTEVTSVEIHKKDRFWVRTFVTTDKPGDGLTRVKTALRVAKAVQETKKADLVQVVVLDVNGPKDRSGMRGRAVGADVVYVPDPAHVPEDVSARMFTARYVDGLAAPNGDFFGERVDMLEVDIEALVAKLNDQTDCVKSETALPEGDGHGAPAAGHGEKAAEGHGESGGHGEAPADGHGKAPADAHGETPAGEHGEETPVAEHGAEESKGWMASLMGMVGLGGDEAPAEGHAVPADGHGAVAEGHEAPAEDHAEPASVAHGEAGTEAETDHVAASTDTHAEQPAADTGHADEQTAHGPAEDTAPHAEAADHDVAVDKAADHNASTEETSDTDGGWFASIKGMVGLGGSEEEVPSEDTAAKTEPSQDADAASTDHGAAWLEQMRAQPISSGGAVQPAAKSEEHGAATDGHAPVGEHAAGSGNTHTQDGHSVPAEDEAVLPPKAKAKGDEHAKAGH